MTSRQPNESLLALHDQRPLVLATVETIGPPVAWPISGETFSLLVDLGPSAAPEGEGMRALARSAIAAGARWVVCRGRWASELEDAFIDELAELGGSLPDGDTVATAVETGPLDEALWKTWHLFDDGSPPVVALLVVGDPAISELRSLSRDLETTFRRVVDRAAGG